MLKKWDEVGEKGEKRRNKRYEDDDGIQNELVVLVKVIGDPSV